MPALGEVGAALDAVNGFREGRPGRCGSTCRRRGRSVLLPIIADRFLARPSGHHLEVTAEDGFVDVLAAGFDAGVRYDERLERT